MNLKYNFRSYYSIYICIAICIFFRIILIKEYGDFTLENEWRVLFNNLYYNKIFAYRSFDEKFIPTVYMPPFYAYYIYFIKLIVQDNFDLVKSVILSQICF